MALPKTWRFLVHNKSGQTLDFAANSANEAATATVQPWHVKSGKAEHGAEVSLAAATDLVNGGVEALTAQSDQEALGLHGVFLVKTDNAEAAGTVVLCIEWSTDGGTTWPSAAANFAPDADALPVCVLALAGAQTRSKPFRV